MKTLRECQSVQELFDVIRDEGFFRYEGDLEPTALDMEEATIAIERAYELGYKAGQHDEGEYLGQQSTSLRPSPASRGYTTS